MVTEFSNTDILATLVEAVAQADKAEQLAIAQAEARASIMHGAKIVQGSACRALLLGGEYAAKWKTKIVCLIKTRGVDGEFDGNYRLVATSDLHQVHHTEATAKALKKAKKADAKPVNNSEVEALKAALAAAGVDPQAVLAEAKADKAEADAEFDLT